MNGFISIVFAAVISFAIAVLSGLGIGSGGLFVIFLTAVYGIGAEQARGMNLMFFVFSASAALLLHSIGKRIKPRLILKLALFSLIGTLLGTRVALYIDPLMLRRIFGIFLVLCGGYTLFSGMGRKRI